MFDNSNFYNNYNHFNQQNVSDEDTHSFYVDERSSNVTSDVLTPLDDSTRFNFTPQRTQMGSKKTALFMDSPYKNPNIYDVSNSNLYAAVSYQNNNLVNMNYNQYFYNPSILGQQSLMYDNNGIQPMYQPIIANNNQNHFGIANNLYQTNNNIALKQNYAFNNSNSTQKNLTNNVNNFSVSEEPQNRSENNKMSTKFKANKKNPILPPKKEKENESFSQNKVHNHYYHSNNHSNNSVSIKKPRMKKAYSNRNTANYNSNYIVKQSSINNQNNENDDSSSVSTSPFTVLTTVSAQSNKFAFTNNDNSSKNTNNDDGRKYSESENNDSERSMLSNQNSCRENQICDQWRAVGICMQGDNCPFSHDTIITDVRMHVTNYKTKPCVDPGRGFECQYHEKCNFAHPGEPLRRPMPIEHDDRQYYVYLLRDCPTNQYPFGIFV